MFQKLAYGKAGPHPYPPGLTSLGQDLPSQLNMTGITDLKEGLATESVELNNSRSRADPQSYGGIKLGQKYRQEYPQLFIIGLEACQVTTGKSPTNPPEVRGI